MTRKPAKFSINVINNNTYLSGILFLLLNIGSKFVTIELSPTQQAFFRNTIVRQLLIFSIVWVGTKDLVVSLVLTGTFIILTRFILNENSQFCIIPDSLIQRIDTNKDGKISDEELNAAIKILSKTKSTI